MRDSKKFASPGPGRKLCPADPLVGKPYESGHLEGFDQRSIPAAGLCSV